MFDAKLPMSGMIETLRIAAIALSSVLLVGCLSDSRGIPSDDVAAESDARYTAEIAELVSEPQVRHAMDFIVSSDARLLRETIEVTEIPAPPFAEENRAAWFADMLRDAGLKDVYTDEVGNVIGRRAGTQSDKVIALSAHLDTVFPAETDVTVRKEGDRYYAPGIGDNSRAVVVVLAILRALQEAHIQTSADVLFIGNVGEEGLGDLRGVKHLFRDGASTIDTLIAVDGGRTNRIVYGGVGSIRYRITIHGPGGHSWGAFGRGNPHHALGRIVSQFSEVVAEITSTGEKSSFNVGRIGGGTSINSIPFESWMEVDMRSGDSAKLEELDTALRDAIENGLEQENAYRSDGAELTVDIDRVGLRPAAKGDIHSPVVQRAIAAMTSVGLDPELRISSTDANLPLSLGIPAVTLSRGGVTENAHSPSESWQNIDSHIAIHIALLTLLAEAGLGS